MTEQKPMTMCNSNFELSEVQYVNSSPENILNKKSETDYRCITSTISADNNNVRDPDRQGPVLWIWIRSLIRPHAQLKLLKLYFPKE
jgi:hypothetical protein